MFTPELSIFWKMLAGAATVVVTLVTIGCGANKSDSPGEPLSLLGTLDGGQRQHDPVNQVEVDLGQFNFTRSLPETSALMFVEFRLVAVISRDDLAEFTKLLGERKERMRGAILEALQQANAEQLADSNMVWIRSEMVPAVNRALHTGAVRDVVFTQFSLDRG